MEVIGQGGENLKSPKSLAKKKIIKAKKETADKLNEVKRGHRERQPVPKGQHAKSPAYSHRGQGSGTAEVDRSFGELGWPTNGKADRLS